ALAAALFFAGSIGVGAAIAVPAPAPPAPAPTPAIVAAVTIAVPADGSFQGSNSFAMSGTKDADSSVVVTATTSGGTTSTVCATTTATTDKLGWSCTATAVPNDKSVTLMATQTADDGSGIASNVTVIAN